MSNPSMEADRAHLGNRDPGEILDFPCGLPGFKEHQQFALRFPLELTPLVYLESLRFPYPRFPLVPVVLIDPDYRLEMESWDREVLYPPTAHDACSEESAANLALYFVLSAPADAEPTVNMLAPIAILPSARRGVQAVRGDARYSHAQPLPTAKVGNR